MKSLKIVLAVCLIAVLAIVSCTPKETGTAGNKMSREDLNYIFPLSLQKTMESSLNRAYEWLTVNQLPNGSWKNNVAISALVLYSLVESPGNVFSDKTGNAIMRGYAYLDQFIREDGSIYENEYSNYTTAVSLMAITAFESTFQSDKYAEAIRKAKDFLINSQLDETENINKDNPFYGGIGYGESNRPDLSNTQLAMEAIKAAEDFEKKYKQILPPDNQKLTEETEKQGLHWEKALVFLARCQNLEGVNKMDYRVENDGGFMYETGIYDERSHSYGSMTYAGVKSLLYANVDRNDLRVVKALDWIKKNYTLDENPGFGTESLYYYYMTFGKCLYTLGSNILQDDKGVKHFWREELINKVLSLQKADGYWANESGRYWENLPDLASAYSIIAMKYGLKGLTAKNIK